MWNTATKISKTYTTNYLMKHLPGTMRSRPEVTAGLMIIMRKSVPANRRSRSMRLFCKSGIKTIWEQRQRTDSLRQKYLINIYRTSNSAIWPGEYKKLEPDCRKGVRAQLERMKELCKERNILYEKQNDLKGQKWKIEKSLER